MCGIAGVAGPGLDPRAELQAMSDSLRHRGPDGSGAVHRQLCSLAMRRLAILDVEGGAQPCSNESESVFSVFNGEIYNFEALHEHLRSRGHRLHGYGDSACLPHLYEEYGDGLFEHLRGMFAIAIWDEQRSRLILARDRLGQKPLYYAAVGGRLWFASELKALLCVGEISRELDPIAIDEYLTYQYVPHPRSILRDVKKLPPGHVLIWEMGEIRVKPYWDLSYASGTALPIGNEEDLAAELRERLLDAVRIRMISERPLGAFLSGGVDSSAVVAAMALQSTAPIKTFSIGFAEQDFDELPYARRVAERFGTEHHELIVDPQVHSLLPRLAAMFDEPFADSSAVPSLLLAEMTREHVVVALNGDGGDEAFGGYTRYAQYLRAGKGMPWPRAVGRLGVGLGGALSSSQLAPSKLRSFGRTLARLANTDPADRYAATVSYFTPLESRALYQRDFTAQLATSDPFQLTRNEWRAADEADVINRMLACDTHLYLPGDLLPKVDITTMAVGLEARSPFLDHPLVEWSATLPGTMKVRDGQTKFLLKRAVEDWLPPDIVHRKKMGFGIPRDAWLQGPLMPLARELLNDPRASIRAYLRGEAVDRLVEDHRHHANHGSRLWALLMLELWFKEVLHR